MAGAMTVIKDAALGAYVAVCSSDARRIRAADLCGEDRANPGSDEAHIRAALHWLVRAQDIGTDAGFSAMYSLVEGWQGSYPETTGYIIPTLFDCSRLFGDDTLSARAVEAADWLRRCQFNNGSFPGSFVGQDSPPRVFNTGQIIFGLVRTTQETRAERFVNAATRAGDWLINQQDADGAWRKATLGHVPHAYNVRTAWALVQLAGATGKARFRQAGLAAADWALTQQCETGWFDNNAFEAHAKVANLHTIAYCLRGLVEIGEATGCRRFIDGAVRAAEALHEIWRRDGFLAGAFGRDWSSPDSWRCLPGEAQLAIVWMRLDQINGGGGFADAAGALLQRVKAAQFLEEPDPDLYGGISGSLPIHEPYERYCLVSWGAKFLIDALLLKGSENGDHPTA